MASFGHASHGSAVSGKLGSAAFLRLSPARRRRILHRLGRFDPWEPGFDFTPPVLPPGMEDGPPDFVGIGAQKSGTTWWYDLVTTHPGVTAPSHLHKERHLLDRFGEQPFGPEDAARYARWFPRRPGTITGEWTPDYATFAWAPELLHRVAPDARLLMLVRNPVDRFVSGVDHYRRRQVPVDGMVLADAVGRGRYTTTVAEWTSVFPSGSLLVLQYERCLVDTDRQLARTFEHLGLPGHGTAGTRGTVRPPAAGRPPLDPEVRRRLVDGYRHEVLALADLVPDLDLDLWPDFAGGAGAPPGGAARDGRRQPGGGSVPTGGPPADGPSSRVRP